MATPRVGDKVRIRCANLYGMTYGLRIVRGLGPKKSIYVNANGYKHYHVHAHEYSLC